MNNPANVKQAVPFLGVTNIAASVRFYVEGLSFTKTKEWTPAGKLRWCWLQHGDAALMLQEFWQGDDEHPANVPTEKLGVGVSICFICADALALYREFTTRDITATRPFVGNGMWVTSVLDPDGYRLEFESYTDAPEEMEFNEEVGKTVSPTKGFTMKARYLCVWPYQNDALNLPVADVEAALPFYESLFGFSVLARHDTPHPSVVLGRDDIQIGLAENGGDPSQDGCFFEVDNAETAFAELKANGLPNATADFRIDRYGDTAYKVFFVVAPDGLCYCLGERQN